LTTMTQGHITPWSQLDDELDGNEDVAASSERGTHPDHTNKPRAEGDREDNLNAKLDAPTPGTEDRAWTSDSATGSKSLRRYLNVAPHWAIAPLAVAVVWLTWGILRNGGAGTGISTTQALGILALILLACGMVFMSRVARRAALADVYRAIHHNTTRTQQVFEDLPIAAELRPLWQAVTRHTADIETRTDQLLEEHKQISLALSLADTKKRHTETIINSIPDPVLVTDAFDQLIHANTAAEGVFGFDRKEALRQPVAEVIPDDKFVRMIRQARDADSRAANRRMEHEIGSRAYAVSMSSLAPASQSDEESSEKHGVVVLLRDVTMEREATRMKSEFVASAAHELRTPLSSIRAYVEMLVDGDAADEKTRKEYYDIIQSSADRLGRMIDNMLNISRIEAGTVRINKEPTAVSMVVKEAVDMARPQAEEKGITLSADLPPVSYRIMADRDMIYQAVLNVLSNAIKYTHKDGRVRVRITPHEENQTIGIVVSDTGVGIPEEDLPKMFTKFFRVEANKKMAKGTGLGLNLVKHIVETIHGGKMTLTSKVGKGSTFGIVLPLVS